MHSPIMSNEGASITAMSDISDRTAFNNGHRQQRHIDRWSKKKKGMQSGDGERGGAVKEGSGGRDGWIETRKEQRRE